MLLECFRNVAQAILKHQIIKISGLRPDFFQHFLDSDPMYSKYRLFKFKQCLNLNNPKRDYPNLNTFFSDPNYPNLNNNCSKKKAMLQGGGMAPA